MSRTQLQSRQLDSGLGGLSCSIPVVLSGGCATRSDADIGGSGGSFLAINDGALLQQ